MKLWKSPALYFGILLILILGGALSAPYTVDWGRYRADIEKFGTQLTGRAVFGPALSVAEACDGEGHSRQSK
jgi:hypothetical protein